MASRDLTIFCRLDQVAAGTVDVSFIDETVKTMLRTKFSLGLFEGECLLSTTLVVSI